ncbi:glycosyltransferase family 2 protein [Butyrivibrio sp. AC2005]|uniref:glycosyltransferase family 2 protein n=1 Tax=Butyrivibrio sp. AC2005 TaxID=1280672 RepID=UPI0004000D47|nr:glycosyltransferase family 2 protein [Butyrivibrio sp. AC2005]
MAETLEKKELFGIKVSVVMPSYNVCQYIDECMKSVLEQTLYDIEIICVDAESTDGTLDILKKYSESDKRVTVITTNVKSYGYQMNLGISMASGDYIALIDTDDYIEPNMLEILYDEARNCDVDYVKGGVRNIYESMESGGVYCNIDWPYGDFYRGLAIEKIMVSPRNVPYIIFQDTYLCNGIYKSSFLKEKLYNESQGAAMQDLGMLFKTISSANKSIYIRKVVYNYRRTNPYSSGYNRKGVNFIVSEYENIKEYLELQSNELQSTFYHKMIQMTNTMFNKMGAIEEYWNESKEGIELIRRVLKEKEQLFINELNSNELVRYNYLMTNDYMLLAHYIKINRTRYDLFTKIYRMCQGKKVCVFGAGKYGKYINFILRGYMHVIDICFCDNNEELVGKTIDGSEVYHLDDVLQNKDTYAFVIANKKYGLEMMMQLLIGGIESEQIVIYDAAPNPVFDVLILSRTFDNC